MLNRELIQGTSGKSFCMGSQICNVGSFSLADVRTAKEGARNFLLLPEFQTVLPPFFPKSLPVKQGDAIVVDYVGVVLALSAANSLPANLR